MDDERYCLAHGRDRQQIEAYLYGDNHIVQEYTSAAAPYVAIIECQASAGFGAKPQADRLASGMNGDGPFTLAEAERRAVERLGATLTSFGEPPAPVGPRGRLSPLADPEPGL